MDKWIIMALVVAAILVSSRAEENLQKWNINTRMDAKITLKCIDDFNITRAQIGDNLVWRKKDSEMSIESNPAVYKLTKENGIDNMVLEFTAKSSTNGIYFCEVTDSMSTPQTSDDKLRGVVSKGVNVRLHVYKDFLDEYERNLAVGFIAAGSVLFLVVSLGLLSQYRYRSPEEISKHRADKEERMRRRNELSNGKNGYDNEGMAMGGKHKQYTVNPDDDGPDYMRTTF